MTTTSRPQIDAVFTWVDGAQLPALEVWRHRSRALLDAGDSGPNRWRDNGELRYSLRSLATNAPWVRRVHLVTAGEVPWWLDPSADGLHLVTHEEIFPDPSVLPTYNSVAIAAVTHRIPGLAERHLDFNDDVFLGRPIDPSDFLTETGGTKVYVEPWPPPSSLVEGTVVDRNIAFNCLLLGSPLPRMLAHAPRLLERARVELVWQRFGALLERTITHRFRSSDDAQLPFLYLNGLLAGGEPHQAVENHGGARLLRVGWDQDLVGALDELRDEQPLSFCLNDDVEDFEADGWMWDTVRTFLAERFPTPSPWEL